MAYVVAFYVYIFCRLNDALKAHLQRFAETGRGMYTYIRSLVSSLATALSLVCTAVIVLLQSLPSRASTAVLKIPASTLCRTVKPQLSIS